MSDEPTEELPATEHATTADDDARMPQWAIRLVAWVAVIGAACVAASVSLWYLLDPADQSQVDHLRDRFDNAATAREHLSDDVSALEEQLRGLGIEPVTDTTTTTTAAPAASPTRTRTTSGTPAPAPAPQVAPGPPAARSPAPDLSDPQTRKACRELFGPHACQQPKK